MVVFDFLLYLARLLFLSIWLQRNGYDDSKQKKSYPGEQRHASNALVGKYASFQVSPGPSNIYLETLTDCRYPGGPCLHWQHSTAVHVSAQNNNKKTGVNSNR